MPPRALASAPPSLRVLDLYALSLPWLRLALSARVFFSRYLWSPCSLLSPDFSVSSRLGPVSFFFPPGLVRSSPIAFVFLSSSVVFFLVCRVAFFLFSRVCDYRPGFFPGPFELAVSLLRGLSPVVRLVLSSLSACFAHFVVASLPFRRFSAVCCLRVGVVPVESFLLLFGYFGCCFSLGAFMSLRSSSVMVISRPPWSLGFFFVHSFRCVAAFPSGPFCFCGFCRWHSGCVLGDIVAFCLVLLSSLPRRLVFAFPSQPLRLVFLFLAVSFFSFIFFFSLPPIFFSFSGFR